MKTWKGRMLFLGWLVGTVYGLLAYAIFTSPLGDWSGAPDAALLSFLALVPVALGALPLLFSDPDQAAWFRNALFIPWASTLGMFHVLGVARLEGPMCYVVILGPFVLFMSVAVWLARAVAMRRLKKAQRKAAAILLLLIPFATARLERRWLARVETDAVETAVSVRASPSEVWRQIVEVAPISDRELPPGLLNLLGIPRPVQATVDVRRVGGTRTGLFEGGLRFVERIVAYNPDRRLRLEVSVDPASVGDAPSVRHALSGAYVSLSTVEYRLRPIAGGGTQLSLACQYQLRSSVNFYGRFWMGTILRDFEARLLRVVRARAEGSAPLKVAAPGASAR